MSIAAPKKIARYQILNHLESGGMGSVYLARDPAIDRLVAIKLLREGFDSAELRARFLREARSAGRLQHPNIVTIFDIGEHQKRPFIAMEYLEGETLHQVIGRGALLSLSRKLQLMDELCAGLHYAHLGGIVHRDIKPSNVMLAGDGVLKVLDFGIARIGDASGTVTRAGILMGTLNYMAPEQMIGAADIDARADMFSAGALFYELLTYQQAFPGGLDSGIMHKIIDASPEPLEKVDPTLDREVIAIVNRCLEKSRDQRYPDMAAVRRDLAVVRRRHDDQHRGAGSKPGRKDLDRLRTTQIQAHLEEARRALDSGDFSAALEASQRALLLNGEHRDALECEQRARTGLEQRQIDEWLMSARTQINRGALTSASLLVDRALSLNSSSPEAAAVRALVDHARQRLAETRDRARAIEAALAAARASLAAGDFDAVAARLDETTALDPPNVEAAAIRHTLLSAVEARRVADEAARARTAMNAANEQFAAGQHAAAIATLERFEPAALVADALDQLRSEFQEIDRLRIDAERQAEARRRADEEARARTAVNTADEQFAAGNHAGAIAGLERFQPAALVAGKLGELRAGFREIERLRIEADRVRQATARTLDDATARFDAQDLEGARVLTREVLAQQPDHRDAGALDAQIDQAIERRRLQAEARRRADEAARARAAVNTAHEQFSAGNHSAAIAALERFEPAALVADALDDLRAELREVDRRRVEAERQTAERRQVVDAAERQRQATARKLDDAAARLAARDLDAARALTRDVLADQPDHGDARALDAEIGQAIEWRRQVDAGLASARAHIDAGRFERARRAIAGVEQLDAAAAELVTLRRAAESGIRAANAAIKRRRDIEERLAAAKRAFESRHLIEALEQVDYALQIDPANADGKALVAAVQAAIQQHRDEQRRQRDETRPRDAADRVEDEHDVMLPTEVIDPDPTVRLGRTPLPDETTMELRTHAASRPGAAPPLALHLPAAPGAPVVDLALQAEIAAQTPQTPTADRSDWVKYAGIGAAVLAIAAMMVWFVSGPASPPLAPAALLGTVVFDIAPWANIEAITTKADGKTVPIDCRETPCVISLPAGEYHVRTGNPNFPGALEFDVTIEPGRIREERRSLPGFRPEEEVSKILDGKN